MYLQCWGMKILNTIKFYLSPRNNVLYPRNNVGGYIAMRPFVCGWASEWVGVCVCPSRPSRFALWAQYRLQFSLDHFQTSHVSCKWWEEEPYWCWVTGLKVKVNFGILSIKPCGTIQTTVFAQSLSKFTKSRSIWHSGCETCRRDKDFQILNV